MTPEMHIAQANRDLEWYADWIAVALVRLDDLMFRAQMDRRLGLDDAEHEGKAEDLRRLIAAARRAKVNARRRRKFHEVIQANPELRLLHRKASRAGMTRHRRAMVGMT